MHGLAIALHPTPPSAALGLDVCDTLRIHVEWLAQTLVWID